MVAGQLIFGVQYDEIVELELNHGESNLSMDSNILKPREQVNFGINLDAKRPSIKNRMIKSYYRRS